MEQTQLHKDNFNKTEILKKVMPVVEKAVEDSSLLLIEADFVKEYERWHLKIFIYHPERPITHKDCGSVTNILAESLDTIIPVHYYLEVSSPGTERKLKSSREYEIYKGSRVKIKLKQPINEKDKIFTGVILDYDKENGLKVRVEETKSIVEIEEKNISYVKLEPEYEY